MKLENTIVIVGDLGELKAFKVQTNERTVNNEVRITHSLELLNDENFIEGRKKLHELKSDANGRINHGTIEEHNVQETIEKRTLEEVAEDINSIVKMTNPKSLFLAFPKEYNNELTQKLSQEIKAVLKKNLPLDLVKADKEKILSHFL